MALVLDDPKEHKPDVIQETLKTLGLRRVLSPIRAGAHLRCLHIFPTL